jgi:hypothetical protein
VCEEKGRVLNVPVPQGDVEASAEADPLTPVSHHHHSKSRARSKKSGDYGAAAGLAYNDNLRAFVKDGDVKKAALDARDALDSPEAAELYGAEEEGKSRSSASLTDRALGVANRVSRAVRAALHELSR